MLNLSFNHSHLEPTTLYFFRNYDLANKTQRFKTALYLLVIVKIIGWFFSFAMLFGERSVIYVQGLRTGTLSDFAFLLNNHPSAKLSLVFLSAALVLCLLALLLRRHTFVPDLLLWLLMINLHHRVYATLTGGDYLLNQLLLFNCFLWYDAGRTGAWSAFTAVVAEFGALAVMVQTCIVYLFSALAKLGDPLWLQGDAVGIIAGIRHYALPFQQPYQGILSMLLSYAVILYQLMFPFLVWIPKLKKPFLLAGLVMHLYIGLVMGLPTFALTMMIPYIFFWPWKTAGAKN